MRPVRQVLIVGSAVWAILGATVALSALPQSTPDSRWFVGMASVVFPAAAAIAAVALRRGALRWAGVLLLVSVATPTYFAWPLNLPALLVGGGLALGYYARSFEEFGDGSPEGGACGGS
jgi:hypothetical protein